MIVSLGALVIALGGTAFAASRYIITSTSQIKPSVLRELRSSAATAAVPKGPKAVIDRVGLVAPVTTITEPADGPFERPAVALTSATWTQAAHQVNVIVGQVTVSNPPEGQCNGGAFIEVELDGTIASIGTVYARQREPYEATTTYQFQWSPPYPPGGEESNATWLIDQERAISHTLSARASDFCRDGSHFRIDSLQIDVLGFR
jgi:hypothetical protein